MIYVCDNCGYVFPAEEGIRQCPDCGSVFIWPASAEEAAEYEQRHAEELQPV